MGMSLRRPLAVAVRLVIRVLKGVTWRLYRVVRLLDPPVEPRLDVEFHRETDHPRVVAYFADLPSRLYQLEQWLPVLEQLHQRHEVLVVTRNRSSFTRLRERDPQLGLVYVRRLTDVEDLCRRLDITLMLYVNHSYLNFNALLFQRPVHVHVNHGESDKVSMASNNAKAYDHVFVAGTAAVDRYRRNLLDFDERRLVCVGRPQLDVEHPSTLAPATRPTVLYAPTWAGDREAMNYSSVDCYGEQIVRQLLDTQAYRLVYKPHSRVKEGLTAAGHAAILAAIAEANQADPEAGHVVETVAPINSLFSGCDAMVTDVSSVGLDFLYLQTGKPLLLTDRRNDRARLLREAPVAAGCDVIDATNVEQTAAMVATALRADTRRDDRLRVRHYYFGDLAPGESTQRFLQAIDDAVAARTRLLAEREDARATAGEPRGGDAANVTAGAEDAAVTSGGDNGTVTSDAENGAVPPGTAHADDVAEQFARRDAGMPAGEGATR